MRKEIELKDCPQELQDKVNWMMAKLTELKILSIQQWIATPYIDKSIEEYRYNVFYEHGTIVGVVSQRVVPSMPMFSESEASDRCLTHGELIEIVKRSETARDAVKFAMKNEGVSE